MLLYNVTVKIEKEINNEWLAWMKDSHIPKVMATGLFLDHRIMRLLEPVDSDGFTYTIQYFCESQNQFQEYRNKHASELQADHSKQFQGKYVVFRTVLEKVD